MSGFTLHANVTKFINTRNLSSFSNLEYLKLGQLADNPFHCLKKLVNLKELDATKFICRLDDIETQFGANLKIINHLPNLKFFTLCRTIDNDFININQVQNQYPHVQFRWIILSQERYA